MTFDDVPKEVLVPGEWVKVGLQGFTLSVKIDRAAKYDGIIEVWGSEFVWEPEPPTHAHRQGVKGYHLIMKEGSITCRPIT